MKFYEKIDRKLHNDNGVSIIIAMFAFLIGTILSVTIITAAMTSLRRVASSRVSMQSQISFNSAAGVIRELIGSEKVTIEKLTRANGDVEIIVTNPNSGGQDDYCSKALENAVDSIENSGSSSDYKKVKIGKIQADEKYNLKDIEIELSVNDSEKEKYKLEILLSEVYESGEKPHKAVLQMSPVIVNSEIMEENDEGEIDIRDITEIRWEKAVVYYD